jgi:hypothetical protein
MARDGSAGFPVGFSGIDPEEMTRLIRLLERGREDLAQVPARWRSMLSGFPEVDTGALNRITRIGGWIDEQIPQLERRRNALMEWSGPQMAGLRPYVESGFATPEEAAGTAGRWRRGWPPSRTRSITRPCWRSWRRTSTTRT